MDTPSNQSNTVPISTQQALDILKKKPSKGSKELPASADYYGDHHKQDIKERKNKQKQRKSLDKRVFILLSAQVTFLCVLILLQGFSLFGFRLDEWAFGVFINGSLIHTYFLIKKITEDLYDGGNKKNQPTISPKRIPPR